MGTKVLRQVRKSLSNSMLSHPRRRDSYTTPMSKSPHPPKKAQNLFVKHPFSCTRMNSFYELGSTRHEALGVTEWMSHAPFSTGNLCNLDGTTRRQNFDSCQIRHSAAIFMVLLHKFICKCNTNYWRLIITMLAVHFPKFGTCAPHCRTTHNRELSVFFFFLCFADRASQYIYLSN